MSFLGPERRVGWPPKPEIGATSVAAPPPSPPKPEDKVTVITAPPVDDKGPDGGATGDDKTVDGGDSLEDMEKAGEAAIAQEADNYSKVRLDDIAEIFELVRALKQPHTPAKPTIERLYTKALDVKGMGNTFGFPLLTKVGELLCGFVWGSDPESFKVLAKLQVVETHAIIMKMIVDQNMHDESDELAKELIGELEVMVEKLKKT